MIIGIDGNEANILPRVGIGEYAFELLKQFSSAQFKNQNSKFFIYLKHKPLSGLPREDENWKYIIFGPRLMWTQLALPLRLYLGRPKLDVFFSPSHYAPRFCSVPSAISIMDMSFHFFPQLFRKKDLYQLTYWTEYSVRKAKRIFTISQASKRDIIKIYKIPEEKVLVTYPGIKPFISLTPRVYTESMLSSQFDIRSPYFLFVGTLQPRKNIVSLIDAFSQIVKSNLSDDLSLIIIGKKGWLFEEILQAPEKYGVSSRVHFLHNVSDDQLPIFYKHAIALVLPSLYEGFGLPVLEAMQNECPVITSNVSSLPEAGGDACLYVDPKDTSDIVKKMMQLLKEKDLRQKLIEKGKRQVKKFSWDKTARQTLEALEDLVRKKD